MKECTDSADAPPWSRCRLPLACAALRSREPSRSRPRLDRAKDFIADEHWERAIDRAQGGRRRSEGSEPGRSAVLAGAQPESGARFRRRGRYDSPARARVPRSRWVKPARSLRIEIAQRLRRNDVLLWTAVPPPPPSRLQHRSCAVAAPPTLPATRRRRRVRRRPGTPAAGCACPLPRPARGRRAPRQRRYRPSSARAAASGSPTDPDPGHRAADSGARQPDSQRPEEA